MADYIEIPTPAGTFDALSAGEEGDRPVLLLHGFPQAAIEWREQLAVLGGAGCHAVAPDQRGYSPGVRPTEVADYRMEELVADVLAIADRLGWARFDLVGHDWGAAVAWAVAAAHPDRVKSLTAVSVPHLDAFARALREDEDQQRRSEYMQVFRRSGSDKLLLEDGARRLRRMYEHKIPEHHVEEYVQRFSEPGALDAALNWYRASKLTEAIGPIRVPTLYVWSTDDGALGSTAALATGDHVTADYRFEMIEDVSHWVPEQAADDLTRVLLEHLIAHQDA
ncbi:alpha/beta hydrolase [Saccharopolyspora gloriosae]|uniref:Pimeloyl-ACP methyl ester carboxylesterase n=1 Tax=Saccharopolyspora gloriosae TaxID=455344 RepID=A0A840NDY2_9PSEU|nr:pimeloyl-ACP methyl ester carboxylesterase [Saccharopolyspora gloriosae]